MLKNIILIVISSFLFACVGRENIVLNEDAKQFKTFQIEDSLVFTSLSDVFIDEPSEMLVYDNHLFIKTFGRAKEKHISVYSIEEDSIKAEYVGIGNGPDEMISCEMNRLDDELWLYDVSKMRVSKMKVDSSCSFSSPQMEHYKLDRYYYRTAMLNDSIMLGTNDYSDEKAMKISFVNLKTGEVLKRGQFSYINQSVDLPPLIDAYSCYVDVNPRTKDILLSYRYTDVIEIYDMYGGFKRSLHGPDCFNVEYQPLSDGKSMGKLPETRKAFVNSYVTADFIYLLYSGCKKTEENWSNGTQLLVYTWDGKPYKRYWLGESIYSFAVDELQGKIYSFSLNTETLIVANL